MIDILQLFVGVTLLTWAAFYVGWTKFRVFCVRQELFQIRDDLWDAARSQNRFDDPAYIEARSNLNAMIRSAHKFSLPIMVYLMREFPQAPSMCRSNSPEMQAEIDRTITLAAVTLTRYAIYYRPFSGLLSVVRWMVTHRTRRFVSAMRDNIAKWLSGGGPGRLESLARS